MSPKAAKGYQPPTFLFVVRLCQPHWSIGYHSHGDLHEMVIVLGGEIAMMVDGKEYIGREGDLMFHPRGVPHKEWAVGAETLEMICFAWRGGEQWLETPLSQWPLLAQDRLGRLRQLGQWMLELHPPHNASGQAMLHSLAHLAVSEFANCLKPADTHLSRLVRAAVQANLAAPLSLQGLAQRCGLSKFHFLRSFVKETGLTPMAFVRHCRLEAARTLLLTTDQPLKAIARQTGFCDEYYFSRAFRQHFHVPPGQVRRQGGCS